MIDAMKQALEALKAADKGIIPGGIGSDERNLMKQAITALRQALAQNPLDVADRAYFAGKQAGIDEALAQPEQSKYSDIVSDGGLDPRNQFDAQPEQKPCGWLKLNTGKFYHEVEGCDPITDKRFLPLYTAPPSKPEPKPVAWLEPEWGEKICPEIGYEMTITEDHPKDLCWIPLYPYPPHSTSATDEEIKAKCPRTDSIWSLGWVAGYKACNQNTAQSYLKGFDESCKKA